MRSYGICQLCGEEILVPEDQDADGFVHTAEDGEDIHAECCQAAGPCHREWTSYEITMGLDN